MNEMDAVRKYETEPRFRNLVDYMAGLMWSGSFTIQEFTYAACVAVAQAKEKIKNTPGHPGNPTASSEVTASAKERQ